MNNERSLTVAVTIMWQVVRSVSNDWECWTEIIDDEVYPTEAEAEARAEYRNEYSCDPSVYYFVREA